MFTGWVSHNNHLSLAKGQNVAFVVIASSKMNYLESLGPILQSHRLCHNHFFFVLSLVSLNCFSPQNMHTYVLQAESFIVILDDITTNEEFV